MSDIANFEDDLMKRLRPRIRRATYGARSPQTAKDFEYEAFRAAIQTLEASGMKKNDAVNVLREMVPAIDRCLKECLA